MASSHCAGAGSEGTGSSGNRDAPRLRIPGKEVRCRLRASKALRARQTFLPEESVRVGRSIVRRPREWESEDLVVCPEGDQEADVAIPSKEDP